MHNKKSNEEVLVNPITAIRLFKNVFLDVGDLILRDRKYKVTREAWIGSMFLLAIKKQFNQEWYFRPETKDGSPDFYCYTFIYNVEKGGSIRPEIKLEVFEWRKEDGESDFFEALKKIKLGKIIDPNLTLVSYVRRGTILPPAIVLNEKLKKLKPKIKDIWYIGDVTPDSKIWRVTQIYPNTIAIDLDYDEILSSKEDHGFVYSYRGKSKGVEYEHAGEKVLLTPEFKFDEVYN